MPLAARPVEQPSRSETFCQLYDRHVERIYRYLLVRTGSAVEAEELTAETFSAAWESFASFREALAPGDGAAAWLCGIARHKLADHFRRSLFRGRPRGAPLAEAERLAAPGPSPEDQAVQRLELARVAAALRRLNAARAEALALHYFAGMSMAQVGQVMGKSEEAAKKLVQRGLAEIQQILRAGAAAAFGADPAAGG